MTKNATRKSRSDSVEAGVDAWEAAYGEAILPPAGVKLRKGDRPIWRRVMLVRAREEWSDVDLLHAANLVRCLADIERLAAEIARDGDTLKNERGTPVINPRHVLLEMLSRRAVRLTKLLHLHAAVLRGQPRDMAGRREAEKAARETAGDADDLLATPNEKPRPH